MTIKEIRKVITEKYGVEVETVLGKTYKFYSESEGNLLAEYNPKTGKLTFIA